MESTILNVVVEDGHPSRLFLGGDGLGALPRLAVDSALGEDALLSLLLGHVVVVLAGAHGHGHAHHDVFGRRGGRGRVLGHGAVVGLAAAGAEGERHRGVCGLSCVVYGVEEGGEEEECP